MDYLSLLKRWMPASELLKFQKRLELSPNQCWFVMAMYAFGDPSDRKLSDITGVPRTTIRDIRKSLLDLGIYSEERGVDDVFQMLSDEQSDVYGVANDTFDSLTAHEKVMVLDQFECRICYTKWRPGERKFHAVKVGEGNSVLDTRLIVCSECRGELKNPDILERMKHYLRGREERLNDRKMTSLSDLEQKTIATIRARSQPNKYNVQNTKNTKHP